MGNAHRFDGGAEFESANRATGKEGSKIEVVRRRNNDNVFRKGQEVSISVCSERQGTVDCPTVRMISGARERTTEILPK